MIKKVFECLSFLFPYIDTKFMLTKMSFVMHFVDIYKQRRSFINYSYYTGLFSMQNFKQKAIKAIKTF